MISISKILDNIKTQEPSENWNIQDISNFSILYYFYKSNQDVPIFPDNISLQTREKIAMQLHEENVKLGSPITINKSLSEMTFYDWLEVHHEILKFKILRKGIRRTTGHKSLPHNVDKILPNRLHRALQPREHSVLLTTMAVTTVALGTIFSLLGHDPTGPGVALIPASIIPIGLVSVFPIEGATSRIVCKKLEKNVSGTWEEVLSFTKEADVLLLDMLQPVLCKNIALRDMTPLEALRLCLVSDSKVQSQFYKEWKNR